MLGLGNRISKTGLVNPVASHVTDNLKMLHRYNAGSVVPVSDGAAYLDGTDDYITFGDVTALDGLSTISFVFWIMPLHTDQIPIITKGDYNDAAMAFHMKLASDRLSLSVANRFDYVNSFGLTMNQWHHVAVTYSNTADEVKMYLNGVDKGAMSAAGGTFGDIQNTSDAMIIGRNTPSGSVYGDMNICNVGIWSSILTQAQIKSIMWKNYAGLTSSETTNLVSWWNFSEDANDSHGSNNGTLS